MAAEPTLPTRKMLATLGDLVEDVIVRIDGPVNVASDTPARISRRRGGSAANVAVAAAGLGHPTRFLGQIGSDAIGSAMLAEMTAAGIDVAMVRRAGSTGMIVALVDASGERSMLTDRRACIDLSDPDPSWLDGVDILHVPALLTRHGRRGGHHDHRHRLGPRPRRRGVDRRVVERRPPRHGPHPSTPPSRRAAPRRDPCQSRRGRHARHRRTAG